MGKAIHLLANQYAFSEFVVIDNETDWLNKEEELKICDVAIEFSIPQTALANVAKCFGYKIPVVSGTTGWRSECDELLNKWRNDDVSIIYGSNFSIGANIFFKLNEFLAQLFQSQSQYEVCIEETHHIHKKDAPSGTALSIKQLISNQFDNQRPISIISHREGEVVGEHIVNYNSNEDIIQVKHAVHVRDAFAHGALKAAVWLIKNPGIYNFEAIFGKV